MGVISNAYKNTVDKLHDKNKAKMGRIILKRILQK